jgi:hypothetical protein
MGGSSGSPALGGGSTRSAGISDRAKIAIPSPARTAASTPFTPRTMHVMRQVRPACSSVCTPSDRLRLGAWYATSGTGPSGAIRVPAIPAQTSGSRRTRRPFGSWPLPTLCFT